MCSQGIEMEVEWRKEEEREGVCVECVLSCVFSRNREGKEGGGKRERGRECVLSVC